MKHLPLKVEINESLWIAYSKLVDDEGDAWYFVRPAWENWTAGCARMKVKIELAKEIK